MEDLVFITPNADFLEDQFFIPSMTTVLLRGWLENKIQDAKIKVFNMCEIGNDYSKLPEAKYYGISFTTPVVLEVKKLYGYLKSKYPDSLVIGGGPHPSALPFDTLQKGLCDGVVRGAGEIPLHKMLQGDLSNIIFLDDVDKSIDDNIHNFYNKPPDPSTYKDVVLRYDDVKLDKYKYFLIINDYGCPHNCNFCFKMYNGLYRFPVEFLYRNLEDCKKITGGDTIVKFSSDNMLIQYEKYNKSVVDKCKELGLPFDGIGRLDSLTVERAKHLKDSGCVVFKVGVETGSPRLLLEMNKKEDLFKMQKGFDIFHEVGLEFGVYLIVDYPSETKEDMDLTIEFVKKLNPMYIGISVYTPYPGSPDWYKRLSEKDRDVLKEHFEQCRHLNKRSEEVSDHKKYLLKAFGKL